MPVEPQPKVLSELWNTSVDLWRTVALVAAIAIAVVASR